MDVDEGEIGVTRRGRRETPRPPPLGSAWPVMGGGKEGRKGRRVRGREGG